MYNVVFGLASIAMAYCLWQEGSVTVMIVGFLACICGGKMSPVFDSIRVAAFSGLAWGFLACILNDGVAALLQAAFGGFLVYVTIKNDSPATDG